MKVLITGSNGFIGKNLISHLQERENIELIKFDKDDDFSLIENNIENIDFIFHLAGVNRPVDPKEFITGNADLTSRIIDLIKEKNLSIPFVITSSIQAALDNDYGKSKKLAEDKVLEYQKNNPAYVYRLHNVFGKWCRPNYNSVVATFCYNIANDIDIQINDPNKELELVYIDDICYEFVSLLDGYVPKSIDGYCYINERYKVTLKELANLLYNFKNCMNSIYVPKTGDKFIKKLFATFVSYLPLDKMSFKATKNTDERGSFTELIRTIDSGQFSVSVSKPGVVRGNHYHHTKMERFIVAKGKARINFKNIVDDSEYTFEVSDEVMEPITIPVGYTHNIENIGDDDMILILWCNELFDKDYPDTFYRKI